MTEGPVNLSALATDGAPDVAPPAGIELTARQRLMGDIGLRISSDGQWHHQGRVIERQELVRLFASVLRRDSAGGHWLITPAEVCPVHVDDTPYLAVGITVTGGTPSDGHEQVITLQTNLGENVTVAEDHPLFLRQPGSGTEGSPPESPPAIPHVRLDGDIEARLTRAVYYDLCTYAVEEWRGEHQFIGVWSNGAFFPLSREPLAELVDEKDE